MSVHRNPPRFRTEPGYGEHGGPSGSNGTSSTGTWISRSLQTLAPQAAHSATGISDAKGELSVLGLPVLTHPGVDAATFFWGIPMDRVMTVLRKDDEVSRSKDSGFYNDALDVRAITRVGIGFLHPAAVVRGYDAA